MITVQRLALGLLSALFLGGYAQAPAFAFLGYVMLVPWSLIYTDRAKGKAVAAVLLPGLILIGVLVGSVVVLMGLAAAVGAVSG